MDIVYEDEMPECENCFKEVTSDEIVESLSEFNQILCNECVEESM